MYKLKMLFTCVSAYQKIEYFNRSGINSIKFRSLAESQQINYKIITLLFNIMGNYDKKNNIFYRFSKSRNAHRDMCAPPMSIMEEKYIPPVFIDKFIVSNFPSIKFPYKKWFT